MHIRYAGIITRKDSPDVLRVGQELVGWYQERSVKAVLDRIDPAMDMLTILGGDGTLLHVADQAAQHGIPVVGINLGDLGFLTEVAADEMYQALDEILHSGITLEERMMLRAKLLDEQGAAVGPALFALNEVVIVKGSTEPMMRLGCWADREYITTYKADGLIVSTPTGSTAYNLSAGGPIAHAELQTLLVTPICPFMLDSRPVLLSPRTRVTAQLAPPSTNVKIMVDGRLGWTMRANDFLSIEAAGKPLRLISSPHKGYFDILRNKLNWGGRDPGYPLPEVIMA
ncbi:MAG: NAD(+)/NADH kinase [Candidatus Electrothrix sp. LOE1_4_5]|nr:NAD(+)/NADH kinase [Candidatus Electrothrix sp. AX1]MCI5117358.1 NAD(+)/NADH kinase [Candidatus Electrothrix gigas]MCI5181634.1 NAD(+)/NADH kinase [Candidatus Electrothrix gigas]MCI5188583.1 NAD(+)/NADH kinase [Candidatus Electrothrix gigas]MCI5191546.1 NAD(+)/NADH kinase [Candidatus Electrothrix gigas]